MRVLESLTGHVIFKLHYSQIYQLKTTYKWKGHNEEKNTTSGELNQSLQQERVEPYSFCHFIFSILV